MDHVAILSNKREYRISNETWLQKIISGKKTIESRWYVNRCAPWDKVHPGDRVFFKEAGDLVKAVADVGHVEQFPSLNKEICTHIFDKYGTEICLENPTYNEYYSHKNYCILVFLKNVTQIEKPFAVNKKGFGISSAWMCVGDIESVKMV